MFDTLLSPVSNMKRSRCIVDIVVLPISLHIGRQCCYQDSYAV